MQWSCPGLKGLTDKSGTRAHEQVQSRMLDLVSELVSVVVWKKQLFFFGCRCGVARGSV
jgi:hypothetical protein